MSDKMKKTLLDNGYTLIDSLCLKNVQPGISHHPDMQLVNSYNGWVCAPEAYSYYKPYFDDAGLVLVKGKTNLQHDYPFDIAYNIASTENIAIHNFKYTDQAFLNLSEQKHINVSQGYAKCSICIVSDNAFITSDEGIYKVLINNGADVLKVSDDKIILPGYDHGFIGGACGLVEKNLLAFCGDVKKHNQYREIEEFCLKYNVEILSLSEEELTDFGTIVSLG